MKLFADACVYRVTEEAVCQWGHDVELAREVGLAAAGNGDILAYALQTDRVLLTRDLDFSNILTYPLSSHEGVIVLKIEPVHIPQVHAVLRDLLSAVTQDEMRHALAIIDRNKWRLRRA